MDMEQTFWKKCSSCKKEIPFSTMYYLCSVSTCRHKRKGFRFCSVPCWDMHLGMMNHREAWAEEATSPSKDEFLRSESAGGSVGRAPVRKIVEDKLSEKGTSIPMKTSGVTTETLVVVTKVKKLVKDRSGFNTSQCAIDALTQKVVEECLKGIEKAKKVDRKTLMGRDIR